MPTVVATPGATNANSYVTKAEASAVGGYFETSLFNTDWTGATVDQRDTAVIMATRLLDTWVEWRGYKADDDQSLRWPRYSVTDRDGDVFEEDEIPQDLKDATAEYAGWLLGQDTDPGAEPDTKGFSKLAVGSLSIEVDKADRDATTVMPDTVKAMVEPYGEIRTRGGGSVELRRA
jgi:hypothetical protein